MPFMIFSISHPWLVFFARVHIKVRVLTNLTPLSLVFKWPIMAVEV